MEIELIAGRPSLDFANNLEKCDLSDYGGLLEFARVTGSLGEDEIARLRRCARRRAAERRDVCRRARSLATAVERVFCATACGEDAPAVALAALNAEVGAAMAHARVDSTAEGFRWSWVVARPVALDRPLWSIARDAADLLVSEELGRLRCCADDSCRWLFVDRSKSGRRRWCDMRSCGNRAKARRYRTRRG